MSRKTERDPHTRIRLQKFLSECGVASRRHSEVLIEEGKVRVNGEVVTQLGTKVDPLRDKVQVRGHIIKPPERGIILLHKPRGVVSTLSDPEGRPTVAHYLTKHYTSYFPVGRLDYDSTGLIVMTNDGELAERLMHPRYGFARTYHTRVEGSVSDTVLQKIRNGVKLADGMIKGRAHILEGDASSTWLEITLSEGRNRVVRRLMERLHHPVMKLKRVTYGPFKLGKLKVGEIRKLPSDEYQRVRKSVLEKPVASTPQR